MFRLTDGCNVLYYYVRFQYINTGSNCFEKTSVERFYAPYIYSPRKFFSSKIKLSSKIRPDQKI